MKPIKELNEYCRLHNYSIVLGRSIKNNKMATTHKGYRTYDYVRGLK